MSMTERHFKQTMKEQYKSFMRCENYITAAYYFDRMVSISNKLGLNVVSTESRHKILYYVIQYTNNNVTNKLPQLVTLINDSVNDLVEAMMKHNLWDIEEGEATKKDIQDDPELSEEDRAELIDSKRG